MKIREMVDKWFIAALIAVAVVFSIELASYFPEMNALEVAGVVFNVILTFGLLAIYWDMSSTQDQQKEIMDKQESLMAANHAPRMQIYDHDIEQVADEVVQSFVAVNEGEGSAENLKGGCQILLSVSTDRALPHHIPMEAYNIHCSPHPLVRVEEEDDLEELSGSSWLNTYEPRIFYGEISFFELEPEEMMNTTLKGMMSKSGSSGDTGVEFGLSFQELKERLPIEEADAVIFKFFIEYNYGDGRDGKKEAPIVITQSTAIERCDTLSEAIEEGYRVPHVPQGTFAESNMKYMS